MDVIVSIEEFRVAINLPPRGNEEGGYDFYEEAYAVWEEMQTTALSGAVVA